MDRILKKDGVKIWTTSNGRGFPFILCNGGPGCDDYLEPVSKMIEDLCEVVRFEPRGCGRSDYDNNYDLETTIDDIEFIRKEYSFNKIIIGGHSAGPDIALAYTIKYPQNVIGLIGIAGGRIVNNREWSEIYHKNLEKYGEDYGGKVFQADPNVNKIGSRTWNEYIKNPNLLSDIAGIKVPAIFINAGKDIRPNWPTIQLANLFKKGVYFEINDAAHTIWLTHYEKLKSLLRDKINEILSHHRN